MNTYFLHTILVILLIYAGVCFVYYFIQEKFIFVPLNLPGERYKSGIPAQAEEFYIETPNKGHIHALLIKSPDSKGIIFYLHGNTGNLKRWQFMGDEISQYGYDVFVMDYRGYGHSKGRKSEAFMHRDAEFCYDFITKKYPEKRHIIYGRSLGCAFATRLASRRKPDLLILETPFLNMIETAHYYMPFLPVKLLLNYKFRSDIYIQHIDCSVYIFHGTKDNVVPYSSALRLYRQAKINNRQVRMTTLVNGKHSDLNKYPLFNDTLKSILDCSRGSKLKRAL